MNHELDLVKDSPREILLKRVQEKRAERKEAMETKRKEEQKALVLRKEEDRRKALKLDEYWKASRINRLKNNFSRQIIDLARRYFNFNSQELEAMPAEQLHELTELIAHTAQKRLVNILFAPVVLSLKFFGWLLEKADNFIDQETFVVLIVVGIITLIFIDLGAGTGLWNAHHKVASLICWAVGSATWAAIPAAVILKSTNKIKSVRNFFEKVMEIECFDGLRHLYCRYRIKKELGTEEMLRFLKSEAGK